MADRIFSDDSVRPIVRVPFHVLGPEGFALPSFFLFLLHSCTFAPPSSALFSVERFPEARPITADMDMENTPAMPAPPGETSNLDGPMTSVQRDFIIISSGVAAGATIAVALRMWTRAVIVKHVGLDDCKLIRMCI